MNFEVFDRPVLDALTAEANSKWGDTDAYHEYEEKTLIGGFDKKLMDTFA